MAYNTFQAALSSTADSTLALRIPVTGPAAVTSFLWSAPPIITVKFTVRGDPTDFGPHEINAIKEVFARKANVSQSEVEVELSPGSVLITVRVTVSASRTRQHVSTSARQHTLTKSCLLATVRFRVPGVEL
jgi:hypothetical protein